MSRRIGSLLPLLPLLLLTLLPAARAAEPPRISSTAPPTFAPAPSQPPASPLLLRMLDDPALAERLLTRGSFARRAGRYLVRPMVRRESYLLFRVTVELEEQGRVEVLFKPRQRGYRDWATEVAACRLARRLAIRVPPCAGRVIPREVLAGALAEVPAACRRRLRWEGGGIYGFFRVWAPGFRHRLGAYKPTRENLLALASWLHVRNRSRVLADPLLRELPDLLLLDYLLYNDDRQWNLGTVRAGKRGLRLFPIDFGEGLSSSLDRASFSHRLFHRAALFSRRAVERLRRLDRAAVRRLLRGPAGGQLVETRHVDQILTRRRHALEHVEWAARRLGQGVLF